MHLDSIIPSLDQLAAPPRRIILHWTGGMYSPSNSDLEAYHFLIDGGGAIHKGRNHVNNNMRNLGNTHVSQYAAHCRLFNSYSVGISFCGMRDARPGNHGAFPLKERQVKLGLLFVGKCMEMWNLNPVDPNHLFTHIEAQTIHGVQQIHKWDITELSFDMQRKDVGTWIRRETFLLHRLNNINPQIKKLEGRERFIITGKPYLRMRDPLDIRFFN